MSGLTPVAEALAMVLASAGGALPAEEVGLADSLGRTLAAPVLALRAQPPFRASAMDGYAVRAADVGLAPARLRLVGESAAGRRHRGALGPGEAVRIFTGAPVPDGADTILIQENAEAGEGIVTALQAAPPGRHIRGAGLDFAAGETLLPAGARLGPEQIALAAAGGHPRLAVTRRPRVAILATGDELVLPGEAAGEDQIIASNTYGVAALVRRAGGEAIDLGLAGDTLEALAEKLEATARAGADVLVTLGGASVGDHDLVGRALANAGMKPGFWKIAMRPGKPLMHGVLGGARVLGLPGNPVSSMVCGRLFVQPLVRALAGDPAAGADESLPARLGAAVAENDQRQEYLRASLSRASDGPPVATPFSRQDSSMLALAARADCLIVRAPFAPAAAEGAACRILPLG